METESRKTDMLETTLDIYGLPIFSCKQCNIKNTRRSTIIKHIQIHLGKENTEACDACGKKFSTQSHLRSHKARVHTRKLDHECFVCQKRFFDKTGLRSHLTRIHDDARKTERPKVKFLPEHLKMELQKTGKVGFEGMQLNVNLVCNHCNKIFQTERYALRHAGLHKNKEKHQSIMDNLNFNKMIKSENIETGKEDSGDKCDFVEKAEIKTQVVSEKTQNVLETCQKLDTVVKEIKNYTKSNLTKKVEGLMLAVSENKQHVFNSFQNPKSLKKSETVLSNSNGFFFKCKKCQNRFNSSKMLRNHTCSQGNEGFENETTSNIKVGTISDHKNNYIINENDADDNSLFEPVQETPVEIVENQCKEEGNKSKPKKGKGSRGPYKKNLHKKAFKAKKMMEKMEYKQKKAIEAMKKMEENISKEPGPEPTLYNFICDLCKRGCHSKEDLTMHKNSHEEEPTLPCPSSECKQTFVKNNILWAHMLKDHGLERDSIAKMEFSCESCDYKTLYRGSLKIHMVKHSTGKLICSECGKNFKYRSSLEDHMKMHKGLFDFPCLQCDSKFISQFRLKAHETAKHTNQSFICEECGKEFRLRQGYTNHMTLHTGKTPHRCREGCEKQFRNYTNRAEHERKHRGIKTFECKYCGKTFMKKDSLRVHVRRHQGRREHRCATCGRGFVEPAGARRCRHSQAHQNTASSVELLSENLRLFPHA